MLEWTSTRRKWGNKLVQLEVGSWWSSPTGQVYWDGSGLGPFGTSQRDDSQTGVNSCLHWKVQTWHSGTLLVPAGASSPLADCRRRRRAAGPAWPGRPPGVWPPCQTKRRTTMQGGRSWPSAASGLPGLWQERMSLMNRSSRAWKRKRGTIKSNLESESTFGGNGGTNVFKCAKGKRYLETVLIECYESTQQTTCIHYFF